MATVKDILDLARSQIGVKESPAKSNNVRYNTEYYGREVYGDEAYPWCMVFVWWIFKHANASELFFSGDKTASCPTFYRWASKTGRWYTSGFQPGDVLIFRFSSDGYDHTGILEECRPDGTYWSIEGNTSIDSDDNGGAVMRRTRYRSQIVGAYRPAYSAEKQEPEKPKEPTEGKDGGLKYEDFLSMYKRARDETDPFYANLEDVPSYWQPEVEAMMKVGAIRGDGVNSVGKRRSELQAMIPAARYVDWYFGEAPGK